MSAAVELDRRSVIDLTTIGRVSGEPHTIEIWFAHHAGTLYMLSGGGNRSDWVRNVARNPSVRVRVGALELAGSARIVTEPAEDRIARDVVFAKYSATYAGDLSEWRESALPVAVDLETAT